MNNGIPVAEEATLLPVLNRATYSESEDKRISLYLDTVPDFINAEMDRLYAHLYCSLSYFELQKEAIGASAYVAHEDNKPSAIFLFKRNGHEITVLNDYVTADVKELDRFARYIFDQFSTVKRITFRKLHTGLKSLPYVRHAAVCSEDMIIDLPATVKDYEKAVGKNMRRNIKRYTSALKKDFSTYCYQLYIENEISEQQVRDIIALSCTRMKSKNIVPRFNEEEIQWIADHARKCGLVGVATIDGQVCAGAIGFRIGDNYFMHVIAHDPKFNEYSLGIVCYYLTICEGISLGAKRFHLLQGRYGYKYRLLAERKDFFHLDIYRNWPTVLRYTRSIINKEVKGRIWLLKQWLLHDVERQEGRAYRLLARLINTLRSAKRARTAAGEHTEAT